MNEKDLESLASWLHCYPVDGRESERKRLTEVVQDEIARIRRGKRLVICDAVQSPHAYSICSCTQGHKNPRLANTVFIPEWGPSIEDPLEPMPIVQWLEERRENCLMIAETKLGAERNGWLDDAEYFRIAISAIELPQQKSNRS